MFRKYPILTRILFFLVAPLIGAIVLLHSHLTTSLSTDSGEITLAGLKAPVSIQFDPQGVPSVTANSEIDAFFAQGYLHASERMWQMETQRRFTQGRVSEIFGSTTVNSDIWMRTIGLYRAAEESWESLSPESKAALTAYANGVNQWLKSAKTLQPEFEIFDIKPEEWRPIDSLVWQKAFALSLGKNMDEEINRFFALKTLSPTQLKTFYPFDSQIAEKKETIPTLSHMQSFSGFKHFAESREELKRQWGIGERFAGSNAWAVSGKYTSTGKPILANDPHLSIQHPSLWYGIQLQGGKLNAEGMSLVGLPGVILGRNRSIAWGAAALMSDQQDLYILDIPLNDNNSYATDLGLKPIHSRIETIHIRTDSPKILNKPIEPVKVRVRTTELGPIVSDSMGFSDLTLALKWSALDDHDNSFDAFYELQFAKNWEQFRHATAKLKSPGIHFVYADVEGNIGSQVAASIPKRSIGEGTLPLDAKLTESYWQGYIPFEQLPFQLNPTSGFIVAANNAVPSVGEYTISHEWAPGIRHDRITQLLKEKINASKKVNLSDMTAIQLDEIDLGAKNLITFLLNESIVEEIKRQSPEKIKKLIFKSLDSLASWDAAFDKNRHEPSIYTYWLNFLNEALFSKGIVNSSISNPQSSIKNRLFAQLTAPQLKDVLSGKGFDWCGNKYDQSNVICKQQIVDSFISAIEKLRKHTRSNNIEEDWKWGNLHRAEYAHKSLGQVKIFEGIFKKEFQIGGNAYTVNAANSVLSDSGDFVQTFGVSFRQIFDLSKKSESLYSLPAGQSGHFMSQHYDDMLIPFIEGKYFTYSKVENKKALMDNTNQDERITQVKSRGDGIKIFRLLPTGVR